MVYGLGFMVYGLWLMINKFFILHSSFFIYFVLHLFCSSFILFFIFFVSMIIAVDFDGTIVAHRYPAIGPEIPFAVDTLKLLARERHKLILWTVREGDLLNEAVEFCRSRGLEFYAVNSNYPEEKPNRYTATLAETRNGIRVLIEKSALGWNFYARSLDVTRWAYLDDFLPDRKEEAR